MSEIKEAKSAETSAKVGTQDEKFKQDLKNVQDQYLDYPYPQRDPEHDKSRIMRMQGDFLAEINHNIFKGKKDFTGCRVLVAGGGTGDSTVWLAKQLMEYKGAEVVYLDFSRASMDIAQKRAKYQKITNITWIEDSILNIPNLNLGKFDYINCTGVLHHLADPAKGLQILSDSLTEDGGMSLMVYAKYGRTGVYQIQNLMNRVNAGEQDRRREVQNGWEIIKALPVSNWYVRGKDLLADHELFGDIGLYDMFLHKQDRSYDIPELYEYVENAGMHMAAYQDPYVKACLNIDSYLKDTPLRQEIKKKPAREIEAMCEIICGSIIKHSVHIAKQPNSQANLYDLDNIPFIQSNNKLCDEIIALIDGRYDEIIGKVIGLTVTMSTGRNMNINLVVMPSTRYFFKYLDKGKFTLREIFDKIRKDLDSDISDDQLLKECANNLKAYNTIGMLYVRHKSVKAFNDFM